MEQKLMKGLEYRLCKELEELHGKKDWTPVDMQAIFHATGGLKNLCKIEEAEMMSDMGGSSHAGRWNAVIGGDYGNIPSHANRGQHWVKGHYSHENGNGNGNSQNGSSYNGNSYNGNSYAGDYSMHDGGLANQIQALMPYAKSDREKSMIQRFLTEARNM